MTGDLRHDPATTDDVVGLLLIVLPTVLLAAITIVAAALAQPSLAGVAGTTGASLAGELARRLLAGDRTAPRTSARTRT